MEQGSRQTIDKTKELKQKLAEDYENQPKVIGALTLDEGRGFVIDPVTVLALHGVLCAHTQSPT